MIRCGLTGDNYDGILLAFEALIDHILPCTLVVALDVFTGIHFLLETMAAITSSPCVVEPLQIVPLDLKEGSIDDGVDVLVLLAPPVEGPSDWFLSLV